MRKIVWRAAVFSAAALLCLRAGAVWVPSTSLEEKADRSEALRQVVDKLKEDERRLSEALRSIEQDRQKLKQLTEETSR